MKRWGGALVALCTASAALPQQRPAAEPCRISHDVGSPRLRELLRENGFAFAGYDQLCALLKRENLGVSMIGSSGVLAERGYGWVSVRLYSRDGYVEGTESRSTTTITRDADTPAADRAMLESMNLAMTDIARTPAKFVQSVRDEEARLRNALRAPAAPVR